MSEISEIVNKGIPISTPINILYNDLLALTGNENKLTKNIEKSFDEYLEYLNSIADIGRIEFFKTMGVFSDEKTLEKKIFFSPSGFYSSLIYNLNAFNVLNDPSVSLDDVALKLTNAIELLEPEFEKRIKKLSLITNDSKFKKNFPFLYKNYEVEKDYYNNILEIEKRINDKSMSEKERIFMKAQLQASYKKNGLDIDVDELFRNAKSFNVSEYCKKLAESFRKLISHSPEILNYLFTHSINVDDLVIDKDKLELYIVNQFIINAELSKDIEDKQRYIYYISNYFRENKERKTATHPRIKVGSVDNENIPKYKRTDGIVVTPNSIYQRFRKMMVENPKLKMIDFSKFDFSGMNLDEVESLVLRYLNELTVNWEIIPEEEIESSITKGIRENTKHLTEEEKQIKRERMLDLYIEKKEFFATTNPLFRVKGKETFDGYVGYIYPNGKVILEKFYKNASNSQVSTGDAIYVLDIGDFYRLSHFTKKVLMNDERVDRIVHSGDWQSKVRKIVESNDKKYSNDILKELIKTNKTEN